MTFATRVDPARARDVGTSSPLMGELFTGAVHCLLLQGKSLYGSVPNVGEKYIPQYIKPAACCAAGCSVAFLGRCPNGRERAASWVRAWGQDVRCRRLRGAARVCDGYMQPALPLLRILHTPAVSTVVCSSKTYMLFCQKLCGACRQGAAGEQGRAPDGYREYRRGRAVACVGKVTLRSPHPIRRQPV